MNHYPQDDIEVRLVPVGDPGLAYVRKSLADGLGLSAAVAPWVDGMSPRAVLPVGAVDDDALLFDRSLGTSATARLVTYVRERFEGALVVAELPMRRPEDPPFSGDEFVPIVRGSDVYATCVSDAASSSIVEDVMSSQDATFLYCAFVFSPDAPATAWLQGNATEIVDSREQILAVITGAYDGEGYVLLTAE